MAAFCRRSRLSQPSFYAWRRKLRGEVTFAEVRLSAATSPRTSEITPAGTGEIELRLPGGRCVVVRSGFDRQTLLELLHTLETSSSNGAAWETVA